MNERIYSAPALRIAVLHESMPLLSGSSVAGPGPSADFMSAPGISSSREAAPSAVSLWEEEE